MKRSQIFLAVLIFCVTLIGMDAQAQPRWMIGGRLGLSMYTIQGAGEFDFRTFQYTTSSSLKAGLQIGPTAEAIFNKKWGIGTDVNINTQAGTPIEWAIFGKYYFNISGSQIRPYGDAGFSLFFSPGGPYFCIRAGGGALFPIAKNLYVAADLQIGPVFTTGSTSFYIAATSGIRYELN
jgi:hypothetical protein